MNTRKEYFQKYYQKNKEKILEYKKEYRQNNKERISERDKEYRDNNKEQIAEYQKEYRQHNKERLTKQKKEYRQSNKEKIAEYDKKYYKNNKEKIIERKTKYEREKRQNDLVYRMIKNYRKRTWEAYKNNTKSKSTIELLGCTGPELAQHLEKQFQPGMTHENYGEWHIDHIRPIASFDLSDPEQEQECFHYTNLQPLWAEDNLSKGHKLT